MSLQRGLHIFYVSDKVTNVPGERQEGTNLYWLYFDGAEIQADQQVPLKADIGRGASGALIGDTLFIHCTFADQSVHQILFDGTTFTDAGAIPVAQSNDRTATVLRHGGLDVFYKDATTGTIIRTSERSSQWPFMQTVLDPSGNAIGLNYGPAAVRMGNETKLMYSELGSDRLKMLRLTDSGVTDQSPQGSWIDHSPAAVLLDRDQSIVALHHGNGDDRNCYMNIYDASGVWTSDVNDQSELQVPDVLLNDAPGACVFGERIYLIKQGVDGCLWCQVYMGNAWLENDVQMLYGGNPLPQVWYGPCVIAV
jgi:hypothetical protein